MNEVERLLTLLNEHFPDIASMDPLEARSVVDSRIGPADNLHEATAEDYLIDAVNRKIEVRVYKGADHDPELPATIYAHGGGFLHGSILGHDWFCRRWANRTKSTTISVNYRLAPEHGAPAGAEDLLEVIEWAKKQKINDRFLLAGDSSGANVAAVTALTLLNAPAVKIVGQVLIYPFLDPDMASESHERLAEGYFVTKKSLGMYWDTYLNAPGTKSAQPWQINPLKALNVNGLPPTIVVTAGNDPLSDEGREYYRLLAWHGVPALHRSYSGLFHGFFTIPNFAAGQSAQEVLWADIKNLIYRAK